MLWRNRWLWLCVALCCSLVSGRGFRDRLQGLVYETEEWTEPKDGWRLNHDEKGTRWNLWTTEADVWSKRSNGQSLKTPTVRKDRQTPEEGAPVLHTRITGIPQGFYQVYMNNTNRLLAISQDGGKTWRPSKPGQEEFLGLHNIQDGVFELWVDDRYATPNNIGSAYYDYIRLMPSERPELYETTTHRLPEGDVMVSWISSIQMPPSTVRYRLVGEAWQNVVEAESGMRNHYVRLPKLNENKAYEVQIVSPVNQQETVSSPIVSFNTFIQQVPASGTEVALQVQERTDESRLSWPVRSGVPLARGVLAGASGATLRDSQGRDVPALFEVMSRWPDGSVKWLVTTFTTDTQAGASSRYTLRLASGGTADDRAGASIAAEDALRMTEPFRQAVAHVNLANGDRLVAELGKGRFTFVDGFAQAEGDFLDASGKARFRWRLEMRCHQGRSATEQADMRFTIGNNDFSDTIALVKSAAVTFPAGAWLGGKGLPLSLSDGQKLPVGGAIKQFLHGASELSLPGADTQQRGNFDGWLGSDNAVLFFKNFWQTYPKGVELSASGLTWWLLPELPAQNYPPQGWDKLAEYTLHWFWYENGCYRFRQGVELAHEFTYRRSAGNVARPAALATDLFAQATPEHYCDSKAFGDLLPYAPERFQEYEAAFTESFQRLERGRHELRQEYGWMSYGDWFGERYWNWGNNEYDMPYALALHFARTGRLELLERGTQMARHYFTVDVCHDAPHPLRELIYGHCVGHTGLFLKPRDERIKAYEATSGKRFLGFLGTMHDTGHAHLPGLFFAACLTGDRQMYDTAVRCAWNQAMKYTPKFNFGIERAAGWPLINATFAYQFTGNPYFLHAAKIYFEKIRSIQNPQTGCFDLPQDQSECDCPDKAQHRGGKAFATGVLMHGLARLWENTHDEQVKHSLVRCADWLLDVSWNEARQGFRYKTGCPKFANHGWFSVIVSEGIAYATELTGNRRYIDFLEQHIGKYLKRATGSGHSSGKDFSQTHRHIPHLLYYFHKYGIDQTCEYTRPVPNDHLVLVDKDGKGVFQLPVNNKTPQDLPCRLTLTEVKGCDLDERTWEWQAKPGMSQAPAIALTMTGEKGSFVAKVTCKGAVYKVPVQVGHPPKQPRIGKDVVFVGSDDSFTLAALRRHGLQARVLGREPSQWQLDGCGSIIMGGDAFAYGKRPPKQLSHYDLLRLVAFVEAGGLVMCFQLNDTDWPRGWFGEPLLVVEPDAKAGRIVKPDHWLLSGVKSIAGQLCYDRIQSADKAWTVLAKDQQGRPCALSLKRGAGEIVIFLPNVDRVYTEPKAMAMSEEDCCQILENVVKRCQQ